MYFVINLIEVCDDHSGQSMLLIIIRFCPSHHLQFVRAFVTIPNLSQLCSCPPAHQSDPGYTHCEEEEDENTSNITVPCKLLVPSGRPPTRDKNKRVFSWHSYSPCKSISNSKA